MRTAPTGTVSQLLQAWGRGDLQAREDLVPLVYQELRKRASAYLRRDTSITSGLWQAVWSRTGTLVHVPPVREPAQLVWVDRSGNVTPASGTFRQYSDLRLSPNGQFLAAHQQNEENDVWINDLTRGTSTRFTLDRLEDETPVCRPTAASWRTRHLAPDRPAASIAGPSTEADPRSWSGAAPNIRTSSIVAR